MGSLTPSRWSIPLLGDFDAGTRQWRAQEASAIRSRNAKARVPVGYADPDAPVHNGGRVGTTRAIKPTVKLGRPTSLCRSWKDTSVSTLWTPGGEHEPEQEPAPEYAGEGPTPEQLEEMI